MTYTPDINDVYVVNYTWTLSAVLSSLPLIRTKSRRAGEILLNPTTLRQRPVSSLINAAPKHSQCTFVASRVMFLQDSGKSNTVRSKVINSVRVTRSRLDKKVDPQLGGGLPFTGCISGHPHMMSSFSFSFCKVLDSVRLGRLVLTA